MPEPKRPLKVFLCHAHADRDSVRGLYTRLTKDGVDAWLDKEKLLPGHDWELEVRKAVRDSDVVVVCLSKQFNQAGFRQKEVRLALDTAMEQPEGEIFIIPARLEECETLESLRKWHWVDLFEENGYEMLMRALQARADKIGATMQVKEGSLSSSSLQPLQNLKPVILNTVQLNDEIVIPVAAPDEILRDYILKFLKQDSILLMVDFKAFYIDTRLNDDAWQLLLFNMNSNGNVVSFEHKKKLGVFSITKLSLSRSKLTITRSDKREKFMTIIYALIQQLIDDHLIDGKIRGI